MDCGIAVEIIVVRRTYQPVNPGFNISVFYSDQSYLANTPALSMRSFKIDGGKSISHIYFIGLRTNVTLIFPGIQKMPEYWHNF